MSNSQQFRHLPLQFVGEGIASSPTGGSRKVSPNTLANRGDVGGHSKKLKTSISSIVSDWQEVQKQRKEEGKPNLPNAVSFILHVDPDLFDAEALKSFGIEVVADLEQGYIIGASADVNLSQLRQQIERFIKGERGGGKIPEIWEILEGTKRPEYILSPKLLEEWEQILDQQEYIVDIGISCIDIREQYSRCPKRERFQNDDRFMKSVNRWLDKHNLDLETWDDLYSTRETQLLEFIHPYNGDILRSVAGDELAVSRLPDSFSCRVRILGAGLKDLVLNFPYIFDVSEPDEFAEPPDLANVSDEESSNFELQAPDLTAPKVCIIDSGIEERHPKLRSAIDTQSSRSWVPGEIDKTSDYVRGGGHGTKVAGAVLYPRGVPRTGKQQALCWLQNARILDASKFVPKGLFPPDVLQDIVAFYFHQTGTRIFNQSIAAIAPCRTQSMSSWAAEIDKLTWQQDILFITAAGNIEPRASFVTRPSISDHLQAGRSYPDYLQTPSARIANPAQSFQALTVGSISQKTYRDLFYASIAEQDHPSSFSCSGPGIWGTIKPEVVEYGGDWVIDSGNPPNFITNEEVCPELVRSTLHGGQSVSADSVGTSFATPKVTHIAAALESAFPQESCLLYRGLIVQSARLPDWVDTPDLLYPAIRTMGYGLPNMERALGNAPNRVTLITQGLEYIGAQKARIYQVQMPESLQSQGESYDILVEITLSYKAEPRRTRRNRRKYLSTWLDWDCSKRGEDSECFLERVLAEYNAPEDAEQGEGLFKWALGKRRGKTADGIVKDLSRTIGTVQKDWAIVKSFDLREAFCIAVKGHQGWNTNPDAIVPYALIVSFEAINAEVPLNALFAEAQVPLEVRQEIRV